MWSEEVKNNLYQGLEAELDNKTFYNTSGLYKTPSYTTSSIPTINTDTDNFTSLGHISFSSDAPVTSFSSTNVRGMSFSNRIENDKKVNSVKDLTSGNQKIYKIDDLLSANFAETTVIPLNNTIPTNMSLVKRFQWKDVWFADVGEAFNMIKNRFFK